MTVVLPDHIPPLVAAVAADTAVRALVTGGAVAAGVAATVRVYGGSLPTPVIMQAGDPDLVAPAVVLATAGGAADEWIDGMFRPRVELRAYGGSAAANTRLYQQVLAALSAPRQVAAGGLLLWFEMRAPTLPVPRVEPSSGFRYAAGFVPFLMIAG